MGKLAASLRRGKAFEGDTGELQKQVNEVYNRMAPIINRKADMVVTDRLPTASDIGFDIGTLWLNTAGPNLRILTDNNPVTWTVIL